MEVCTLLIGNVVVFCICNVMGVSTSFLLLLDNNIFIDKKLQFSSYMKYNFSITKFHLHRSPENIACNNRTIFLTNIFPNIYFRSIL